MVEYTPILRWKRGERVGLANLSNQAKIHTTPLFVVRAEQYKNRAATRTRAALSAADSFAAEVTTAWGNSPFFVDASAIPSVHGQPHPLHQMISSCLAVNLPIIPSTRLLAPHPYQNAVQAAYALNNRVALRIDLQETMTIANWVNQWPYALGNTDLIIDFDTQISTAVNLGPVIDQLFINLHQGTQWRSVTIAGTSMPANFAGYAAGLHTIARDELVLWQRLNNLNLPYPINYGDFTATTPGAPPPGIAWGYPINVKYTLANSFLICRGVGTTGPQGVDSGVQLLQHANSIMNYGNRQPMNNIWSDQTIDAIANGNASTQTLEHWVQLAVNRHIEFVRSVLP